MNRIALGKVTVSKSGKVTGVFVTKQVEHWRFCYCTYYQTPSKLQSKLSKEYDQNKVQDVARFPSNYQEQNEEGSLNQSPLLPDYLALAPILLSKI